MSEEPSENNNSGDGISNEALGLVIVGLVVLWFILGILYVIYSGGAS